MHKIPVIILNYNSSADCRKCVKGLKEQRGAELELVIVDNCSREEDRAAVRELCAKERCTLLESPENRGYNAGNNIGLRYAVEKGYNYAMIANPDMEFPQEGYVAELVRVMEELPDVAVVGSDIVGLDGIHQSPMNRDGDWRESFGWITGLIKKKNAEAYDFIDNWQTSHYCAKVSGCCFLIRLSFAENIGFFDENVFLYCEEAILSRQVEQSGMKMYYLAEAQAVHAHVKSKKGDPVKRFENWKKSRLYFIKRYSGDSWLGRMIASSSMRLYILLFKCYGKMKRNVGFRKEKKPIN